MEVKGKVIEIGDTQQISDSLKKREFVLEYVENPQYPEYLKFECIGDRTALLDNVLPGDDVEVFFNLRGRPWTDKTGKKNYFNSLQIWRIVVLAGGATQQENAPAEQSASSDDDDLPF